MRQSAMPRCFSLSPSGQALPHRNRGWLPPGSGSRFWRKKTRPAARILLALWRLCFANDARPQEWRNRDRAARTDASCSYWFLSSSNLLGRIFSGQRIPANLYHFSKHANPIAQRTDARAFPVCPCNRTFVNIQPELFRQVEQFGIEAPAFHRLQRKNRLRGSTCERLEAALRVPEGEA